ncbi:MAG TPA: DUF190 domain-containing protein [Ignavibacteriales bacterium]|nr:DUF190 domain-containing protein [Ignavibacteriales bacterium]HOL81323.1 DUF190 domain-containing protein [Ignavibacteriales bacterium]HPP33908.1 DUF190 domain-containing protein [Ignavibacteriales bacterium]HRT99761.1 DUF190 domain-containing protein [Ignavibacteriales bacterium]
MTHKKITFYFSSTDKYGKKPLYYALLELAKENNIQGGTVIHGIAGYGKASKIRTRTLFEIEEKIPIFVEFIDKEEVILNFFEKVKTLLNSVNKGILVTIEGVDVLHYQLPQGK